MNIFEKTFDLIPSQRSLPVSDLNLSIVNYGFLDTNFNPAQINMIKPEHVLQYIFEGEGYFTINNTTYHIKEGDLFYLPKNTLVSYYPDKTNPYRYYWVGFDGPSVKELLSIAGISKQTPVKRLSNDNLTQTLKELGLGLYNNNFAGLISAYGNLYKFFSLILQQSEKGLLPLQDSTTSHVVKAISYIKNNFGSDINVTDIAKHVGLKRSYFSTLFSKHTGVSPIDYLMRYRIDRARIMLSSGMSVTDTAMNCGFNSISNFSVQFKKITGISPINSKLSKK